MKPIRKILYVKAILIGLVGIAYWMARLPKADNADALAEQFTIERIALPFTAGESQTERVVHPSIERLSRWVSSSGSAVAICDLNLDGLANEIVLCEPRTDEILLYQVQKDGSIEGPRTILSLDEVTGVMVEDHPVAFAPIGLLAADLNRDGWGDILVFYMGRSPVILYQQPQAESWKELSAYAGQVEDLLDSPEIWNSNTAIACDVNGDTCLDIIIGNYGTDGVHYLDPLDADSGGRGPRPTAPASMSRAFNGGSNRFFCWEPEVQGFVPGDPAIFRLEDGEPVPISDSLYRQISEGWTLAIAAVDLNGDLLPELYFANDFGPDRFLLNRSSPEQLRFVLVEGERDMRTPRSKVLGHDSFKGMGVDFADVNGDQYLDMFVSNLTTEFAFEESHFLRISHEAYPEHLEEGNDPFYERSEAMGVARSHWAWDAKFADLNNDGVFEILQATGFVDGVENRWARFHELVMSNDALVEDPTRWPNLMGLGNDGLAGNAPNSIFVFDDEKDQFFDIAHVLDFMKVPAEVGRGVALADVDRDGDQDFVFSNQWQDSYLLINHHHKTASAESPLAGPKDFIALDLFLDTSPATTGIQQLSPQSSRIGLLTAVGASVKVWEEGSGEYIGMDYIDGGNGYTGQNAPGVHVAVPDPTVEMVKVEVAWLAAPGVVRRESLKLAPGYHALALPLSSKGTVPTENPVVTNP